MHVCSTLKLGVSGVEIDYEHIRFAGPSGGGGGVSELMDRRGCVILALEVVPKNLIFA